MLAKAGLTLADIDVFEYHEAFAVSLIFFNFPITDICISVIKLSPSLTRDVSPPFA